jgi:hypothetical protein
MLCAGCRCGGVKVCLFLVIFPVWCISSVSPRFYFRRHAFCFLPLATILESLPILSKHFSFHTKSTDWESSMSPKLLQAAASGPSRVGLSLSVQLNSHTTSSPPQSLLPQGFVHLFVGSFNICATLGFVEFEMRQMSCLAEIHSLRN